MRIYPIGYGGRMPEDLLKRLREVGVHTVGDVRLRPQRAYMSFYQKAKTPDEGIEKLFSSAGIGYCSLPELGNLFLEYEDWRERYATFIKCAGHLLVSRLEKLEAPICLLCAERCLADCHRLQLAEFLRDSGAEVEHLDGEQRENARKA